MSHRLEHLLPNGLLLLVEPLARPAVATHLVLPVGTAHDARGAEGTARLLHAWCQRGAGGRDTRALNEALENLGAARGGSAGRQATNWSLTCLADDWAKALPLLADTILDPRLPADEFEPVRQLALAELSGLDDQPARKLGVELTARYFPGDFGRGALGSSETLSAATPDALRAAWRAQYQPAGAVLSVAGGVDPDEAIARLTDAFGSWAGAPPAPLAVEPRIGAHYEHVTASTEQVHIGLASPAVPPTDANRYQASVASAVLSGGMGARLFTEVREKRGLCYSVGSRLQMIAGHGYQLTQAGTTTERSAETLEVTLGELRRLAGSVTAEEVERARVGLLSNEVMAEESTGARAGRAAQDWWLLGRVRSAAEVRAGLEAVTATSVNDYLAAHEPAGYTVVTLGTGFDWPAGLSL